MTRVALLALLLVGCSTPAAQVLFDDPAGGEAVDGEVLRRTLEDRLDLLQTAVGGYEARITALEDELAAARSGEATLGDRLLALDAGAVEGRVAAAEVAIEALQDVDSGARLDGLEGIDAEARLATLEVVDAAARLVDLEATDADQRLDELEGINTEIRLAALEFVSSEARLTALEALTAGPRLNSLEALNAGARITALEGADAEVRLTALEGADAEVRLTALEGTDAEVRLTALEGTDAGVRLTALEGTDAENRLDDLESELATLDGDLATLDAEAVRLIASSTSLNIPADFATPQAALDYLDGFAIARDAVVTLQFAAGTHALTEAISIRHPDGDRIHLIGDPSDSSAVVLQFPGTDGVFLINGSRLGGIDGLTLQGDGAAGVGVRLMRQSSAFISPGVVIDGFNTGIQVVSNSSVVASGVEITGCATGIGSQVGSVVSATESVITAPTLGCWTASNGSTLIAAQGDCTNPGTWGGQAVTGATLYAYEATVSGAVDGWTATRGSIVDARGTATHATSCHYAAVLDGHVDARSGATNSGPATTCVTQVAADDGAWVAE